MAQNFATGTSAASRFARSRFALFGAAIALTVSVAACGSGSNASPAASPAGSIAASGAASGATVVKMTNEMKFDPAQITIKVGTTVRWENVASVVHTSTDDASKAPDPKDAALPSGAQPWDSGLLQPGQTFEHTFTVPGAYTYFCLPHASAGMIGQITVTP
jgi:plastocyanin